MRRGSIDHLDLTVADVEAAEPLYRAVLGYMGFELVRLAHGNTELRIFQAVERGQRLFSVAAASPALNQPFGYIGAVSEPGCGPISVERTTWGGFKAKYESAP